jgi:hypothetical protein
MATTASARNSVANVSLWREMSLELATLSEDQRRLPFRENELLNALAAEQGD